MSDQDVAKTEETAVEETAPEVETVTPPPAEPEEIVAASDKCSQFIPVNRISIPKDYGGTKHSKEQRIQLVESIKASGLLQPVGLVPDKLKPEHYKLVFGRNRYEAVKQDLKWDLIEAKVFTSFDENDVQLARLAENLARKELTKEERIVERKRFVEALVAKFPDLAGKAAGPKIRAAKNEKAKVEAENQAKIEEAEAKGEEVKPEDLKPVPETTSISEKVADAAGIGVDQAKRLVAGMSRLTEEQVRSLAAADVSEDDMLRKISTIPDKDDRGKVVNLVVSGLPVDDAVATVRGGGDTKTEELDDNAWVEKFCGELLKKVARPEALKASAAFYRSTRSAREAFKQKIAPKLGDIAKAIGKDQSPGPFVRLVNQVVLVAHPKDWKLCGTCGGKGERPEGTQPGKFVGCAACRGDGFKTDIAR